MHQIPYLINTSTNLSFTKLLSRLGIAGVFLFFETATANADIINNGSFETGDLSGWGVSDWINFDSPWYSWAVVDDGVSPGFGFFASSATNGAHSAVHHFDGNGPGAIRLFQNIGTIDSSYCLLTFDYRVAWDMLNYSGSVLPRTFSVSIYDSTIFGTLEVYEIFSAAAGTLNLDTGSLRGSIDLNSFQGKSVGVSFDFYVPERYTGPAFFQLDNVALTSVSEPPLTVVFGLAASGIVCYGRRKSKSQRLTKLQYKSYPQIGECQCSVSLRL
jgi:hypothetical protein